MSLTFRMVKTLLLAFIFAAGVYTNGFAFDLTQRHSEEVPKATDVFSKAWLVEAQKQFDSVHSTDRMDLLVSAGIFIILFIAYGVSRLGRTPGVRLYSSKPVQSIIAQQRFELRLICRWGGAIAVPIVYFRRIPISLHSAHSRLSSNVS